MATMARMAWVVGTGWLALALTAACGSSSDEGSGGNAGASGSGGAAGAAGAGAAAGSGGSGAAAGSAGAGGAAGSGGIAGSASGGTAGSAGAAGSGGSGGDPLQDPSVSIYHPGDGECRVVNQTIPCSGIATDPQDGNLTGAAVVWSSSLEGQIGTGTQTSFTPLVEGSHVITLTATDSDANTGSDVITIQVKASCP